MKSTQKNNPVRALRHVERGADKSYGFINCDQIYIGFDFHVNILF